MVDKPNYIENASDDKSLSGISALQQLKLIMGSTSCLELSTAPLLKSAVGEADLKQMRVLGPPAGRTCQVCSTEDALVLQGCECKGGGFHRECFQQLMQQKLARAEREPRKEEGQWSYKCGQCGARMKFKCEEQVGEVEYQRWFYPVAGVFMSVAAIIIGAILRSRLTIAISFFFLLLAGCVCRSWVRADLKRATRLLHLRMQT